MQPFPSSQAPWATDTSPAIRSLGMPDKNTVRVPSGTTDFPCHPSDRARSTIYQRRDRSASYRFLPCTLGAKDAPRTDSEKLAYAASPNPPSPSPEPCTPMVQCRRQESPTREMSFDTARRESSDSILTRASCVLTEHKLDPMADTRSEEMSAYKVPSEMPLAIRQV